MIQNIKKELLTAHTMLYINPNEPKHTLKYYHYSIFINLLENLKIRLKQLHAVKKILSQEIQEEKDLQNICIRTLQNTNKQTIEGCIVTMLINLQTIGFIINSHRISPTQEILQSAEILKMQQYYNNLYTITKSLIQHTDLNISNIICKINAAIDAQEQFTTEAYKNSKETTTTPTYCQPNILKLYCEIDQEKILESIQPAKIKNAPQKPPTASTTDYKKITPTPQNLEHKQKSWASNNLQPLHHNYYLTQEQPLKEQQHTKTKQSFPQNQTQQPAQYIGGTQYSQANLQMQQNLQNTWRAPRQHPPFEQWQNPQPKQHLGRGSQANLQMQQNPQSTWRAPRQHPPFEQWQTFAKQNKPLEQNGPLEQQQHTKQNLHQKRHLKEYPLYTASKIQKTEPGSTLTMARATKYIKNMQQQYQK